MLNKEKLFVLALKELVFYLTYHLRQKYSLDIKHRPFGFASLLGYSHYQL